MLVSEMEKKPEISNSTTSAVICAHKGKSVMATRAGKYENRSCQHHAVFQVTRK
jgi:hypothetical protein